jgi:DNA-binding PadR family transcriptional regulator
MSILTYRRPGALGVSRVRRSRARRRVLLALLSGADNLHGYRLCSAAGVWSGTLYPYLEHLTAAGWVTGESRIVEHRKLRCYRLTAEGRLHAAAELGLIFPASAPWQ